MVALARCRCVACRFLPGAGPRARRRRRTPSRAPRAPGRGTGATCVDLVDGAALRHRPEQRRSLAATTLGLLADAGMSSLTYNAVAARSGVGTATLQRYWTSRVDAVSDAVHEVFGDDPVPDTGDLRPTCATYLRDVAGVLGTDRAQQVLGALMAEAGTDPELAAALRDRVVEPRRAALAARLAADPGQLAGPVDAAVDQLTGPIYGRVLIAGQTLDDELVDAVVAGVLRDTPT